MGLYDRDYYRPSSREKEYYQIQTQQSWVFAIIVVNIMVFFANAIRGEGVINGMMVMQSTTLAHPTEWWRLITYAFAHGDLMHVFFNMLALFFFGPLVERKYGPAEFMCFYFVTAVLAGVVWGVLNFGELAGIRSGEEIPRAMLGASGAVSGIIMIVICSYPRVSVYLMGILEMPMWLMGTIFIGFDLLGFLGFGGSRPVAYEAHLAGVAFGALYWWLKWRFTDLPLLFSRQYWKERQRRDRFFNPQKYVDQYNHGMEDETSDREKKRAEQVDAILQKIHEKGQDSLTWNERRILKRASEESRKKNKPK